MVEPSSLCGRSEAARMMLVERHSCSHSSVLRVFPPFICSTLACLTHVRILLMHHNP